MRADDIVSVEMRTGEWGKTRAYLDITFANGMTISGWKIIEGPKGLFVGSPSIQKKDKESGEIKWTNICFIKEDEDRKVFQDRILAEYRDSNKKSGGSFTDKNRGVNRKDGSDTRAASDEGDWWEERG